MNEFIDLELQSEVANLRAENSRLQIRYDASQAALRDVLTEVNKGKLFYEDELEVLRRLVDGYFVGPKGRAVLLKLHTKEADEDICIQHCV